MFTSPLLCIADEEEEAETVTVPLLHPTLSEGMLSHEAYSTGTSAAQLQPHVAETVTVIFPPEQPNDPLSGEIE